MLPPCLSRRMRRILIIAATIAVTASAVRGEDAPSSNSPASSERGPNFPSSQRGPEFPAIPSNQGPVPSFGTTAPTPKSAMYHYKLSQSSGATLASVKFQLSRNDEPMCAIFVRFGARRCGVVTPGVKTEPGRSDEQGRNVLQTTTHEQAQYRPASGSFATLARDRPA